MILSNHSVAANTYVTSTSTLEQYWSKLTTRIQVLEVQISSI